MKAGIKLFVGSFVLGLIAAALKIIASGYVAEVLLWITLICFVVSIALILRALFSSSKV